jgi:hypothetical protein
VRRGVEFGEGPLACGRQVAQRDFMAKLVRDFAPALVKHLSAW